MISAIQNAPPVTLQYFYNGKQKEVTYEPLIVAGKVLNDNQKKAIEILYHNKFTFPTLDNKELDRFTKHKEIHLSWGRKKIHLKMA